VRVLVGEDETLIRLDLKAMLERAGFEVCAEARDGVEALELARSEQPDLAVLDVKMPRLDGIEAARRMLGERPIPIVIVSAFTEQSLVSRAADAGVFGYLAKPFREDDLLPAIVTARARFGELAAVRDQVDTLADALARAQGDRAGQGDPDGEAGTLRGRGVLPAPQGEPGLGAPYARNRGGSNRDILSLICIIRAELSNMPRWPRLRSSVRPGTPDRRPSTACSGTRSSRSSRSAPTRSPASLRRPSISA